MKQLLLCEQCKTAKYPRQLINGKCLDCYRLKADDTAEKIRDNWETKVYEITLKIIDARDPNPPLAIFFMKAKRWVYGAGEYVLDKAIDKAVGKFSWIIFAVLIVVIVGVFIKKGK